MVTREKNHMIKFTRCSVVDGRQIRELLRQFDYFDLRLLPPLLFSYCHSGLAECQDHLT